MARNNCGFRPYSGRNPSFGLNGRRINLLVRQGGLVQDFTAGMPLNVCQAQVTTDNGNGQSGGGLADMQTVKCFNFAQYYGVNIKFSFDTGGAAFDCYSSPWFTGVPWTPAQLVAALNDPNNQQNYGGGAYVGTVWAALPNGSGVYVVSGTVPGFFVLDGDPNGTKLFSADCEIPA